MKEMGETQVWCLVQEDPLEEELALHPLQYSCLEIPMDRGAWWAIVHGVAKNRTWLSNWALKIVTPNKAKLLSRSTLQDLWPKWFSSPLERNQSYAAPTLPLPSAWNILLYLVIIQGKCPPPQRGLSALQFNCLCELSILSPHMFLSLKNGSLLKIVQAFPPSPVTRMWACESEDGVCLLWGSVSSLGPCLALSNI